MKKLFAAGVMLAGVLGCASAQADSVSQIEAYSGGNWIFMTSGNNGGIGSNDTSANTIFSLALAAEANFWHNCALYTAGSVGWGYGSNGASNVAIFYAPTN